MKVRHDVDMKGIDHMEVWNDWDDYPVQWVRMSQTEHEHWLKYKERQRNANADFWLGWVIGFITIPCLWGLFRLLSVAVTLTARAVGAQP